MSKEHSPQGEIYAQLNTYEFLKAVIADGAIGRVTKSGDVSPRDLNVTGIYLVSPATLEEISNIYPSFNTKQRTWQIVRSTTKKFWENCSQETQEKFPWDEIDFAKPRTLKTRQRMSAVRGGKSYEVARLLGEGYDIKKILEETGITKRQIATARRVLREQEGQKIEVPFIKAKTPTENLEEFARELEEATDTNTIRQLLNEVTPGFYQWDFQRENRLLIPIRKVAREFFRYSNSDTHLFAAALKEKGIPIGIIQQIIKSGPRKGLIQRRYFIHHQHLSLAREILDQNSFLAQYKEPKVKQVFGPKAENLPTSWEIQEERGLKILALIFARLGITVGGWSNPTISDFLGGKDCPVPVFIHDGRHAIFDDHEEELKEFIIQQFCVL